MLALLPIGAVNLFQGAMQIVRDTDDARRRLHQSALANTEDEQNIFAGAQHLLHSLADLAPVRAAEANCRETLVSAIGGMPYFNNIARVGQDGQVLCSALPTEVDNVATRPWWPEVGRHNDYFLSEQVLRATSGTLTLLAVLPLFTSAGQRDGALILSIDVRWLDELLQAKPLPADTVVALLDRSYRIVATNRHETAQAIFADLSPGAARDEITTSHDQDGEAWIFAVAPVAGKDMFAAYALRRSDLFGWTYLNVGIHLGLPVVMIALACGVIWLATHRLVLRWISLLRRIAGAYEKGHYQIRPTALSDAPLEFQQLGEAFYTMADAVRDRDHRLRAALDYKAAAIREIHHRVKNNLQIVMSLLNLQATRMQEPAASEALAQARLRVSALAVVHSILHDVETADAVDTQRLLEELARQIHSGLDGDAAHIALRLEVAPILLSIDQATPLALFVVEALSNAYKHAWPGQGGAAKPPSRVAVVRLTHDERQIDLTVQDDGRGSEDTGEGQTVVQGSGTKLMQAFARQLKGSLTLETPAGGGTLVRLVFPLRRWQALQGGAAPGTPSPPAR